MAFAQNDGYATDDMTMEAIAEHIDEVTDMSAARVVDLGSAEKSGATDAAHS